jgi:hypothetical protein
MSRKAVVSFLATAIIAPIIVYWLTQGGSPTQPWLAATTPTLQPSATARPTETPAPSPTPGPRVLDIRIIEWKATPETVSLSEPQSVTRSSYSLMRGVYEEPGFASSATFGFYYSIVNDGNESGQLCKINVSQYFASRRSQGTIPISGEFGIPSNRQPITGNTEYTAELTRWGSSSRFSRLLGDQYTADIVTFIVCRNGQSHPF